MKIYAKNKDWPAPVTIPGATWIPISKSAFALVDDADVNDLDQFHWHLTAWGYAARTVRLANGKQGEEKMHKRLCACPSGLEVDHINRNRVDNRRSNLRPVTRAENQANRADRGDG